jgi:hypothetical protein
MPRPARSTFFASAATMVVPQLNTERADPAATHLWLQRRRTTRLLSQESLPNRIVILSGTFFIVILYFLLNVLTSES